VSDSDRREEPAPTGPGPPATAVLPGSATLRLRRRYDAAGKPRGYRHTLEIVDEASGAILAGSDPGIVSLGPEHLLAAPAALGMLALMEVLTGPSRSHDRHPRDVLSLQGGIATSGAAVLEVNLRIRGGMRMSDDCPYLLRAATIAAKEATFSHPWNAKSELTGTQLGRLAGLKRTGVSIARIPPGKESFCYHAHHREEEWIYILSGRGVALINGAEYEVRAGDFVGFPAPGVAHQLANPFDEPLVYLMGGENVEHEIADFPTLDRRVIRSGDRVDVHRLSDAAPFPGR
jgi:uncharacterized cupin superfamily protein